MNDSRREPNVGRLEELAPHDRIPTLTEIATPETPGSGDDSAETERASGEEAEHAGAEPAGEPRTPGLFAEAEAQAPEPERPGDPAADVTAAPETGDADKWPDFDDYDDFVSELARRDERPAVRETAEAETATPQAPPVSEEEIEALADRVLDQLAPVLREAVTAALQDLLARRNSSSS